MSIVASSTKMVCSVCLSCVYVVLITVDGLDKRGEESVPLLVVRARFSALSSGCNSSSSSSHNATLLAPSPSVSVYLSFSPSY